MAVYSYTTSTISPQISEYSSSSISVFANYVVSEFGKRGNNLFKILSSSKSEEVVSYSFNPSSYNLLEFEDYGFITELLDSSDDYGLISEIHSETVVYGLITTLESLIPYGTIKVPKSKSITLFNLRSIGGVEFYLQGGSIESFGSPYIGYDISVLSGRIGESVTPATHTSSGSIFTFLSSTETNTESYLQKPELLKLSGRSLEKNTESYIGSGTFSAFISSSESIGSNIPERIELFRINGSLIEKNTESYSGFGNIYCSGFVIESNPESYVGSGHLKLSGTLLESTSPATEVGSVSIFSFVSKTESFGPNPPENIALFRISGAATDIKNTESYFGSGSLFALVDLDERRTYSYNESAQGSYITFDRGFISFEPDLDDEDYGLITEPDLFVENEDFGVITFDTEAPVYGSVLIFGESDPVFNLSHIGSGSLFGFSSTTESFGPNTPENTALFKFTGDAELKNTESYVGSGGLRSLSEIEIKIIITISVDSGGLIRISGSGIEKNTESHFGSGSLFGFSSTTESFGPNPPENTILFRISGAAKESTTPATEVGFGSLFEIGTKEERRTYSYNQSADEDFINEDYGYVFDSADSLEDYGSINELPFNTPREDYGFIVSPAKRVFGLFNINGSGDESTTEPYIGSGSAFSFDSKAESFSLNPPENTALFKFTGAATDIKNTESYFGSGSLFAFVSKIESSTFSPETKVLFTISGSAAESTTPATEVGSGSLFGFSSTTESFGLNPLENTALFKFTGAATESTTPATEVGSGSLFAFVSKTESTLVAPPVSGLFKIGGSLIEKNTESYVGSGSLFGFSSTTETTRLASTSSGLFKIIGAATESTAPATEVGSGSLFGFSSATETTRLASISSGLFRISGAATDIKNTESYFGSGSLFGFSSTTESTTFSPEIKVLFRFSGSAAESTTPTTEIGFGILQISQKVVKLDDKNKSRLVSAYESRSSTPEIYGCDVKLYGSVFLYFEYRDTGSGKLTLGGNAKIQTNPVHTGLGKIQIASNAFPVSYSLSEIGSGSVFSFVSKAESFGPNPPENTALFKFTGAATDIKNTESYFGSGKKTIEGKTFSVFKLLHIGTGVTRFLGSGDESTTESYVGSGSVFSFDSKAESFGPNPPENTALFRISGAATDIKNTESYFGSGSLFTFISKTESTTFSPETKVLFTISGSGDESITESYVGSGSLFGFSSTTESFGPNPPENTALFRISGAATDIKNTESYFGSGSVFSFASKTESTLVAPPVSGLFKIGGSLIEKITESYVGSGSLFGFSSTTESFGPNPPENTALFRISGAATESTTPATEVGSGSIFSFVSKIESSTFSPETKVLFRISGSGIEKNTESHFGSGSLFGFSSTTESFGPNPPENTALFRISGAATESTTPATEVGSGSIFSFVSKTESTTFSPETKVLFKIGGSLIEKNTESYVGSGSLFGFNGISEAFIFRYQTQQRLFRVFGTKEESFGKGLYSGNNQTFISGKSNNKKIDYISPKPSRIYII